MQLFPILSSIIMYSYTSCWYHHLSCIHGMFLARASLMENQPLSQDTSIGTDILEVFSDVNVLIRYIIIKGFALNLKGFLTLLECFL
jgi:hypothetical protein